MIRWAIINWVFAVIVREPIVILNGMDKFAGVLAIKSDDAR